MKEIQGDHPPRPVGLMRVLQGYSFGNRQRRSADKGGGLVAVVRGVRNVTPAACL